MTTSGVLDRVRQVLHERRDAVFLVDGQTASTLTYGECGAIAARLASELARRGAGRGDRVALVLNNSLECALLYFACLLGGAVVVPVAPTLHRREVDAILQIARPSLVIDSPSTLDAFDRTLLPVGTAFWRVAPAAERRAPIDPHQLESWSVGDPLPASAAWEPRRTASPEDLFSINFTSGTTSLPKGVAHSVGGLIGNAISFNEALSIGASRRFLHVFPMAYMAGFLNTLLCPFMAGASVVVDGPFGARHALRFWSSVRRHHVDTLWLAPTMIAAILGADRDPAAPEYCRQFIRTISVGTAPVSRSLKDAFERRYGVELLESYGLSELLFVTTNSPRTARCKGSGGRPLPGVELRVAAEDGGIAAAGADGELQVRTPFAMVGYLDAHTSQPHVSTDEWFSTGDLGHLSPDGDVFITGRKKDLIIRGGVNVSPRAIEDVLMEHAAVAQVAVLGMAHEFHGEEIVAVVKMKDGHTLGSELSSLFACCSGRLSAVAVPSRFIEVQEFPVTVSGKIQKNRLRQDLMTGAASHVT